MRVTILAIGRLKRGPESELVARYATRLSGARQAGVSGFDIIEMPESRAGDAAARKAEEAGAIRARLPEGALTLAFDERGRAISSDEFARSIGDARDAGRDVAAIIGGPDGLDPGLRAEADRVIAFGRLTLPHQIVRALVAEQLYRATTILTGHPYHRS